MSHQTTATALDVVQNIQLQEEQLLELESQLCPLQRLLICGDMNVAHQPVDLKNAKSNEGNAGFTVEERGKMTELLASGFSDAFRFKYPDRTDAYTWWSYMMHAREKNVGWSYRFHAREKNVGWRIDYWILSDRIVPKVDDVIIHSDVMGSDHCPLELQISL